jgi:hypothetical protein
MNLIVYYLNYLEEEKMTVKIFKYQEELKNFKIDSGSNFNKAKV